MGGLEQDTGPAGADRAEAGRGGPGQRARHRAGRGSEAATGGGTVGGWAQDRDGQIICQFLEDAGTGAVAAAKAAAQRLAGLLGGVRPTARTRGMTWLEQELSS